MNRSSWFFASCLYLLPAWRSVARPLLAAALVALPALGITLLQNRAVTGSWTTLPYALSQYQYGVPSALTFQSNPAPHRELTREQELDYQMQLSFRGDRAETMGSYVLRLAYRIRYYRFFFMPPLYLALPFFLVALRECGWCGWRFVRWSWHWESTSFRHSSIITWPESRACLFWRRQPGCGS